VAESQRYWLANDRYKMGSPVIERDPGADDAFGKQRHA